MLVLGILASQFVGAGPLLEQDVLPILQKNCMGCHGGLIQKGELDLRTGIEYWTQRVPRR